MAEFNKPHIDISSRAVRRNYQAPRPGMGGGSAPRARAKHGARIRAEMEAAFEAADNTRTEDERLDPPKGTYLEVALQAGSNPEAVLERKRDGIRTGAVIRTDDGEEVQNNTPTRVALFVPDEARAVLEEIIKDYTYGDLTEKGTAPRKNKIEPIDAIRQARLETFWTDEPEALPRESNDMIWWEVWSYPGQADKIADAAARVELIVADHQYWLTFPETTVIPIYASRIEMELLLFAATGIAELRRASASPAFFTESEYEDQTEWTENLAERVIWPGNNVPAVCLMDTGVNRGHSLLEPALSADDLLTVNATWGGTDDHGHGTWMAGVALLGDLTPRLEEDTQITLGHRLESVKVLPPDEQPPNDPKSYGSITQSAVAIAEINNPERQRTFCLAITNDSVSGARATTWSAAIDQAASGNMAGDGEQTPARLFVISVGNAPAPIEVNEIQSSDNLPIEDPAQSWNALSVGGYTNKSEVHDDGFTDWMPIAQPGELSPFSRTSITWPQNRSALKPDVVFEAGNRAINPAETEASNFDSLSLLTTGENLAAQPLVPFAATSAAAAQCAKLAAELSATYPQFWPETIRALIVHSAEWTPWMLQELNTARNMTARYPLLRKFGHGVPSLERAIASAENHLALVAQNGIKPFKSEKGTKRFSDCHFYKLPWPKDILENLGEQDVRLKLTLSYFVEPNPGRFASIDAQRYQSYGLRFDLKRRAENEGDFVERINALEREDPLGPGPAASDNTGWRFGPNSISAGSLHCDVWTGSAIALAARDMICVKPVIGWWRQSVANCKRSGRYALIATLSSPNLDIDLHTPIQISVENEVEVEIQF